MRWWRGRDFSSVVRAAAARAVLRRNSALALTSVLPIVLFVVAAVLVTLQSRRTAEQGAQHEAQNLAIAVGDAYGSQMARIDMAIVSLVTYVEGQLAKGDLDL